MLDSYNALNYFGNSRFRKFCRYCKRHKCKCSKKRGTKIRNCKKKCKKIKKKCKKVCRRTRFGAVYYKGNIVHRDAKGRFIRKLSGTRGRRVYRKQYLPRGAKTGTKKSYSKPVKNKGGRVVGRRLSARSVYNQHGRGALGKSYRILQKDGRYKTKVLKLRRNGSPYFANKFGTLYKFGSSHPTSVCRPTHVNISYRHGVNGLNYDDMTGYKDSWPNNSFAIPGPGLEHAHKMSLYPRGMKFGSCFG